MAFLFAASASLDVYDAHPEYDSALAVAKKNILAAKEACTKLHCSEIPRMQPVDKKSDSFLLLMVRIVTLPYYVLMISMLEFKFRCL